MAPDRVIPDSDDDSDANGFSPEKPVSHPLPNPETELDNTTSLPSEGSAPRDHQSIGSTEQLVRDLQSAQRHLAGPTPTPQHLAVPSLEWNSSHSPTISKVNRRQTTMGMTTMSMVESQRENSTKSKRRKTMKTYGSRGSQESSSLFGEEFGATMLSFYGTRMKRARFEGPGDGEGDEVGFNGNGESGITFAVNTDRISDGNQLGPVSSEYGTFDEQNGAPHGLESTNVEDEMLLNTDMNLSAGEARDSRGLRETSNDPTLGVLPSSLGFAGHTSNLAVDLLSTVALTESQKKRYGSTLDGVQLLQELWPKGSEDSSTVPTPSDERYNSQLHDIEKSMEDSSDPQLQELSLQLGRSVEKRTPGRSKSMHIDISSSRDVLSSSPVKQKPNKRSKTSIAPNESQDAPQTKESLALPPSVKDKAEKKSLKRGRKPKAKAEESTDELGSDELVGLPKEQYKPRPSRSRSGTVDDHEVEPPQSSPKKSGPNSDEIAIGLPKEQYKPRPSRSRGGKAAEVLMDLDLVKPKKKLKRGMTTGRILKKKVVDSDDEDEVIYVDERPRKDTDKRTRLEMVKEGVPEGLHDVDSAGPKESLQHVEIEMRRTLPEPNDNKGVSENASDVFSPEKPLEAKKRGRKPKATTDTVADSGDMNVDSEDPEFHETHARTFEIPVPEPRKRGRKRKQTMETVSEAEETPDTNEVPPTQEESIEVTEPIPAEGATAEPKKRGRKRKKTVDMPANDTSELADVRLAERETDKPLKEKDPNTKPAVQATVTTNKRNKSRLLADSSQSQDENQDEEADVQITTKSSKAATSKPPPETPRKPSATDTENMASGTPTTSATAATTTKQDTEAKGPTKHSPISTQKVPFRVGLSKRARIAPLLKMGSVRK